MTYEEYMSELEEQIKNKKAKDLVRQEFENHIEEQKESYMVEGMAEETALTEAIRQMGDPVAAGQALNRIHRPKFPLRLLALAIILTIFGVCMQGIIFSHVDLGYHAPNSQNVWILPSFHYLGKTILFNILGLGIIIAMLYLNYNLFIKFIFIFYGIYLCFVAAGGFIIVDYHSYWSYNYSLWMVYPLIFAGLLYRFKDKGIGGIFICEALTLAIFLAKILFPGNVTFSSAVIECYVIIIFLLFLSIKKGIFGAPGKKLYAAGLLMFLPAFSLCLLPWMPPYYTARLKSMLLFFTGTQLEGEGYYLVNHLRENIPQYSLIGGSTLPDYISPGELYTNFMLTSAFSWFGIIPGLMVVVLLILFCLMALKSALRQRNRMGMLLGSACGISILVRVLAYTFSNLGYGEYYTISVPFLAYGGINILLNAVYVGFVLCVFRNTNILKEEC